MADIFLKPDVEKMMQNKTVYFCGDSNMRGNYKDFIQLITSNVLIDDQKLKTKMEPSFKGDKRISNSSMTKDRNASEHRQFINGDGRILYHFVTKCYSDRTEEILRDMTEFPPDVVIYNSCLWDICRWGFNGPDQFKVNLNHLMKRFKEVLPEHCIVIWMTTPPISSKVIKSAFLIKQVEFMRHSMRFEIMEANLYASHVVSQHGYDCVDVHYHLRWQLHRRTEDGVHWKPDAVRYVTNLWLTHVALAWGTPLPNNTSSQLLTDAVNMVNERVGDDATQATHGEPVGVATPDISPLAVRPSKRCKRRVARRFLKGARPRNPNPNGWVNLTHSDGGRGGEDGQSSLLPQRQSSGPAGPRMHGSSGPAGPRMHGSSRPAGPRTQGGEFHMVENEGRHNWQQRPLISFAPNPVSLFQFQNPRNQMNMWQLQNQQQLHEIGNVRQNPFDAMPNGNWFDDASFRGNWN